MRSPEGLDRILDAEALALNHLRQGEEVSYEDVQKQNGLFVCSLRVRDEESRIDSLLHFRQMHGDSDQVERILHDGTSISWEFFMTARNFAKDVIRIAVELTDGGSLHHFENTVGGNSDHRNH